MESMDERNMTRRDLLSTAAKVATAVGVVPILAACGTTPTSTAPASGAIKVTSLKGSHLTMLVDNNILGAAQKLVIPQWEKETGMNVTFDLYGETTIYQKITADLASGVTTEGLVDADLATLYQWAKAGWILPIDSYLADKTLTPSNLLDLPDYIPAQWKLGKVPFTGHRYGFPSFFSTKLLGYRKDILARYNLKPPNTIDELVTVCKTLASHGQPAIAMRGIRGSSGNIWPFETFLFGEGGSYFKNFPHDLHLALATPESIKAATVYADLLQHYSVPGVQNFDFPQVRQAFLGGQVAMIIEEAQGIGLMFNPKVNPYAQHVGAALVPKGPGGRHAGLNTFVFCIPKSYYNPTAAYRLALWLASAKTQLATSMLGQQIAVTRSSVWDNPKFKAKYNYDGGEYLKVYHETLSHYAHGDAIPAIPVIRQVLDIVSIGVSEAVSGIKSPALAMKDAQDAGNTLMSQNGYI